MQKSKNAFTMIEMVFVIVVLGILASIAIPRFAATRTDAVITKGRSDIASVRSGIVTERQTWLIRGVSTYIKTGTGTETINGETRKNMDTGGLFGGVMMYPITASSENGHWSFVARDVNQSSYNFKIKGVNTTFIYNVASGTFTCTADLNDCNALVN